MFHLIRLYKVLLDCCSCFTRICALEKVHLPLMVFPDDLDFNLHMNNSRYLKLMDLGRLQYLVRNGLFRHCLFHRWQFVAGAIDITYLRPMKLFQKYTLVTELVCWDEKWVVLEQRFEVKGLVYAKGRVRKLILDKNGKTVPLKQVFETFNLVFQDCPQPSDSTLIWLESLKKIRKNTRKS